MNTIFKFFVIVLFLMFIGVNTSQVAFAQTNLSCKSANYKNQNYIDIVAKPNEKVQMFLDTAGFMKVVIEKNGTVVATATKHIVDSFALMDTRPEQSASTTYRYKIYWCSNSAYTSCTQAPRWMPSNVSPHQYKCGTGCQVDGYTFAVVSKKAMYDAAVADGYTPYDLSGYSLFLPAQRTVGVDTSITCWNDQVDEPGTADEDFNDMAAMWSVKTVVPPTTIPPTTVPPTTVPPTTVPPTTLPPTTLPPTRTPSVTHTPEDTGFADDIFLYIGGALYAVGVIAFMGARVLATKKVKR